MDFMGIGPMELLLILVIALLVFGPKKLPEIGRQLGKTMQSFRKASQDLTKQLTSEAEEGQKTIKEEVVKPLAEAASSVGKAPFEVVKQPATEAPKNQAETEGTGTSPSEPPR